MLASWNIAILKSKLSHLRWCNVLITWGYKTFIGLINFAFKAFNCYVELMLNSTLFFLYPQAKREVVPIKTALYTLWATFHNKHSSSVLLCPFHFPSDLHFLWSFLMFQYASLLNNYKRPILTCQGGQALRVWQPPSPLTPPFPLVLLVVVTAGPFQGQGPPLSAVIAARQALQSRCTHLMNCHPV